MQLSMLDGLDLYSLRCVLPSHADHVARSRPLTNRSDVPPKGAGIYRVPRKFHADPGSRIPDPGRALYVVSRSSLIRFPPRIASLSAVLSAVLLTIGSTVTGQPKGVSVPKTTWVVPISATRCRTPSGENTIASARMFVRMYSLGFRLMMHCCPFRWQATSVRPR